MRSPRRILTVAAALATMLPPLLADPAAAGTATVYQCKTPSGAVAATDLISDATGPYRAWDTIAYSNDCAAGGTLQLGLTVTGVDWHSDFRRRVTFSAPAGTVFVGGSIDRTISNYYYWTGTQPSWALGYRLRSTDGQTVDRCGSPGDLPGPTDCAYNSPTDGAAAPYGPSSEFRASSVSLPQAPQAGYSWELGCYLEDYCFARTQTTSTFQRLRFLLGDPTPPTIGAVDGSLVSDPVVRGGAADVTVAASDDQLGVYRVVMLVDGKVSEVQGFAGGACQDVAPGNGDPYEFAAGHPCPTHATTTFSFTALPEGQHVVRLLVEDAAGNQAVALNRTVMIDRVPADQAGGRGAPNGENPSDEAKLTARFTGTGRSTLTVPYGRRVVIRGTLRNAAGAGIRNAKIELVATNTNPGAQALDKGGARTRPDGSWTLTLPANSTSRALAFRYRSHFADVQPAAATKLQLRVRAGVAFGVFPHRSHNGGTIRFTGRLLGRPVPSRGKLVELQARGKGGGRWLTFRTLRSDKQGYFRSRYRFRSTYGSVTYVFRARSRAESAYPFMTGSSRVVGVRVR